MAHKHSVYDTDLHFAIDPIKRNIVNMSTAKTQLIQNDHNSERFTFECSRLVELHDMSVCDKVEIHYINVSHHNEKSEDVYLVDDLQVSPSSNDTVIFSWLISANATKYAGTLNFLIRFVCLDGEKVAYAWHTGVFKSISVGEGMNNAAAVIETPPDILEAWKKEVLGDAEAAAMRAEAAATRAETAETAANDKAAMAEEAAEDAETAATNASAAATRAETAATRAEALIGEYAAEVDELYNTIGGDA